MLGASHSFTFCLLFMDGKERQQSGKRISYHSRNYSYIYWVFYYIKSVITITLDRDRRKGNGSEKRCNVRWVATEWRLMIKSSRNLNYYACVCVCLFLCVIIYGWLSKQCLFPTELKHCLLKECRLSVCLYRLLLNTHVDTQLTGGSWKDISCICQNVDEFSLNYKQTKKLYVYNI